MLIVPLGVIGALLAATGRGLTNDVYFQVGLLTTVGLSAKNAILIVEFAQAQLDHGLGLFEATLSAAKMRLRPILMTSLAFGLGVLPLATSTGAGSGSQNAIGNRRARRHDLGHRARHLLRAGVLRRHPPDLQGQASNSGRCRK